MEKSKNPFTSPPVPTPGIKDDSWNVKIVYEKNKRGKRLGYARDLHNQMKHDYIVNGMTRMAIAKKYGRSVSLISTLIAKRKWKKARDKYRERVSERVTERYEDAAVQEGFDLVIALEKLLKLKVDSETEVFLKAQGIKNLKDIMHLVNKSKDSIAELTKVVQLLKGKATENIGGSVGVEIYDEMLKKFGKDRGFIEYEPASDN